MKDCFKVKSKRLAKYLYSLGFDKESQIINNEEVWFFKKNNLLQEALDFYFDMRNRNK